MKFLNAPVMALVAVTFTTTCPVNAAPGRSGLSKEKFGAGDWRLIVASDRFSGGHHCALRSQDQRIAYVGNAFAFRLKHAGSPSEANFRVDDGAPRNVRDQMPELARLRVFAYRIDDASAPRVYLPVGPLSGARIISISPKFGARPHRFSLDGFADLYSKAVANGCLTGTWTTE